MGALEPGGTQDDSGYYRHGKNTEKKIKNTSDTIELNRHLYEVSKGCDVNAGQASQKLGSGKKREETFKSST